MSPFYRGDGENDPTPWDPVGDGYALNDPKRPEVAGASKGLKKHSKRLLLIDGKGNGHYVDPEADALKDQGGAA